MKVTGFEQVLANIQRLKNSAKAILQQDLETFGQAGVDTLRQQLSDPFQTQVSYVRHGPPAKKYPPGTIGTYSKRTPEIAGTPLEERAALYLEGPHRLRDELSHDVEVSPAQVSLTIGYPPDAATGRNSEAYIKHVLFGTEKMQSRNFLARFIESNRDTFLQMMRETGRKIVTALR